MKMLNLFGKSMVSVAVMAVVCAANAAQNGRVSVMGNVATPRMPVMPTVGLTTIGNTGVTTVNQPVSNPAVTPAPQPNPQPQPATTCPDGGVENSSYTVNMCMNDILQCINNGALQGGMNDLFNEDVRNAIMSGMKLCQINVDKCIKEVRVDCRNVYNQFTDVWLDFNSRIIQPEYYNFVLRKTGLTPNQAENTCLLLDRNTYGESFAAVSDINAVNTEYNQKVGAYNSALNGILSKDNPQGVTVNTVGYDGNRGHYARWDAAKAECLIRVAAYNKDKLITNSWLFGAVGDENPAEVWEKAGSTFTCSKELFDFDSLLNDTKTAAVIGIGGGAVLGTTVGAMAGAGAYKKKHKAYENESERQYDLCADEEYRKKLGKAISDSHYGSILASYAYESTRYDSSSKKFEGTSVFDDYNFLNLKDDEDKCRKIWAIHDKVELYKSAVSKCDTPSNTKIANKIGQYLQDNQLVEDIQLTNGKIHIFVTSGDPIECPLDGLQIQESEIEAFKECLFVPLQMGLVLAEYDNPLCKHGGQCLTIAQINKQISEIERLLNSIEKAAEFDKPKDADKGKEIGKGAGIGLATGVAAGGLATAITALVEKNNISCKVGDGLYSVSLGKAYTIDSLKDFYVKWNLNLPDTVSPTSVVVDRASWEQACSQFNNKLMDCPRVQIHLKDAVTGKYTLIPSACVVSGSICIVNDPVATSHGI
jgi:hypothetical protein